MSHATYIFREHRSKRLSDAAQLKRQQYRRTSVTSARADIWVTDHFKQWNSGACHSFIFSRICIFTCRNRHQGRRCAPRLIKCILFNFAKIRSAGPNPEEWRAINRARVHCVRLIEPNDHESAARLSRRQIATNKTPTNTFSQRAQRPSPNKIMPRVRRKSKIKFHFKVNQHNTASATYVQRFQRFLEARLSFTDDRQTTFVDQFISFSLRAYAPANKIVLQRSETKNHTGIATWHFVVVATHDDGNWSRGCWVNWTRQSVILPCSTNYTETVDILFRHGQRKLIQATVTCWNSGFCSQQSTHLLWYACFGVLRLTN